MAGIGEVLRQEGQAAFDEHQVLQVLLFLPPACAASVRATSQAGALARAAGSEPLWAAHAGRIFGLAGEAACQGPQGVTCSSWAFAFQLWHSAAREVGLSAIGEAPACAPLPARWIALWCRLRRWLQEHAPGVGSTLRSAADSEALAQLAAHGFDGAHPGVLGLWRVIDGQDAAVEQQLAAELGMRALSRCDEWSRGLLGGYSVYEHDVSTVLLPVRVAIRLTAFLREHIPALEVEHPTKLAFACSYNLSKVFFVEVRAGGVWAWTRRPRPLLEPAAPASAGGLAEGAQVRLRNLQARPDLNGQLGTLASFERDRGRWQVRAEGASGVHLIKEENLEPTAAREELVPGLLRWFEEFTQRLELGVYSTMALRPERVSEVQATRGISLFPAAGPELSRCVTKGVEVTASCVYMPEHRQGWTYSIALRLVGSASERGYKTCQLDVRHWVIQEDGREAEHVRGEGVVGFFPILADGGWLLNEESDPNEQYSQPHGHVQGEFRYQSCSGRSQSMKGTFSGDLTFIPGTRRRPTGPPFQARLENFRLCVPEYIY
mmetsp:Transcript_108213/g.328906  ORF Transcript_108213/g.328906 Transcript_108213/m.328906 type:complete len:548 (-) Transcript_108213:264-1907(-)